ncbi:MAG: ABC transporter ATP-binding protein [Bacilli bacterium]|nr:ABC transporter ATP-binding protein [Bacilli bacterium]
MEEKEVLTPQEEKEIIIKAENLGISFRGLKAVQNLNLEIRKNQLYGLIGPNGAGKTTAFNIITGVYKPTTGKYYLCGEDVTGLSQQEICKKGIARTFQNIRLYNNMSVIQNVMVGMANNPMYHCNLAQTLFRTPRFFKTERAMRQAGKELLQVFGLYELRNEQASNLPYGKQRKLEIARALATNPKLLLLDEPAAGMNEEETRELMNTIRFVRDKFDITVLLIEHDMKLVSGICDEVTVLNFGQVLTQGPTKEALANKEVIKAYLGGDDEDGNN